MLHRCDVRDGEGWRGADRTDEARKRHENHGNRGSSWIAALGQHACRQSPRSSAGTAMLRLLHDRGQAGEFDLRARRVPFPSSKIALEPLSPTSKKIAKALALFVQSRLAERDFLWRAHGHNPQ